ncbi:unnamed protein product (macronuclear) [Paramecium tetraurelia]|uniref:Uncharacterized protein n=1 Tax=Paramecium tetraurelia TaxID=5888 RepID=A0D7Z5_PARTE|nr:uncharacterized protein GSPATT00014129001 [Paramecium tetraurelia]CAK79162.1 unnamed protein product [Paramecium tetraurelia]|eukprot:XP_001446559.1 hypothetical protein (macronuclear) [Paramecium tetraurelia strain d4-2]
MKKFLLFLTIISIVFSIQETTTHSDCLTQYCSAEVEACRKDSTCKKQIADCYQTAMDDLSPAGIQRSKAAYDLCLSTNSYAKVQNLAKCKQRNCPNKLLII